MSDTHNAEKAAVQATCPHGDPACPCPDDGPCHYEGHDAMICPNPVLGVIGLTNPHCHIEGCSWLVTTCARHVSGECGLLKLGLPPVTTLDGEPIYSMTQARPGQPGWACGWLRTPLNVGSREVPQSNGYAPTEATR